ncbi:MAG: L,D-transpeptidase [Rhizobiaceae bacterium]|nr:L,D-transpeptidase [Rhizobiaceae bacterium]
MLNRRDFCIGTLLLGTSAALAVEGLTEIKDMRPGEFTWHPDREVKGPVAIIVSLPQQRVHVYRNGIRIAVSTCSSGKPGHDTPTGVFVILQKDKFHKSSTYSDAPMPNMNRLTWSGIALHAGNLPGYPASHGCVRLPMAFSADLFSITHLGTPVIIAGPNDPRDLTEPGMVLDGYEAGQFENIVASQDGRKHPDDWAEAESYPITSVIASSSDKSILLIQNDEIIAQGPLSVSGGSSLGNHVFSLQARGGSQALQWIEVSRSGGAGATLFQKKSVLNRIGLSKDFADTLRSNMHAGMVLVLTDAPLHPDSRTGDDFVVMATDS